MTESIRILFVGELHSSHALSWINLLRPFAGHFAIQGVALGAVPDAVDFPVHGGPAGRSLTERGLSRWYRQRYRDWADSIRPVYAYGYPEECYPALVAALSSFRPHIVHTFGFTPGALFYGSVPKALRAGIRWVLQTRGGSDVAFTLQDPVWQELFCRFLPEAGVVLCDNLENYRLFNELDIDFRRSSLLPFVPGTGGLDFSEFPLSKKLEERERLLIWNKAYESPWSKALPVLEGLRLAWERVAPLRCVFTAVDTEVRSHVRLLPASIRESIELRDRIPRLEMLDLMRKARVILAPSLVDGIPNTLYEAMAAGAIPIVSPLAGMLPHFAEGEHVFYARNLYPQDIAEALVRALTSPARMAMVRANRALVLEMADRPRIAERVVALYESLVV